jgi:2-C-methyl-D-erythritol 4-phosphate cytidylyltransferase
MTSAADPTFAAIIPAGGSGSRFGSENKESGKAKQFLTLRGLPLYAWSLLAFGRHERVSRIVLVTPSQVVPSIQEEISALANEHGLNKLIDVVPGGATRQASVYNGLKSLAGSANPPDYAIIHDAARPFLNLQLIDRVIEKVIEYGACTVGHPVSDTIKRVQSGTITETIPRDDLVAVQTPQAGRFSDLLAAHEKAAAENFATTDDAALLEWAGHKVTIVDGPPNNMKVTQPLDLILAEALGDYLLSDRL